MKQKYQKKDIYLQKKDTKIIDELRLIQYINKMEYQKNSKFVRQYVKSTI